MFSGCRAAVHTGREVLLSCPLHAYGPVPILRPLLDPASSLYRCLTSPLSSHHTLSSGCLYPSVRSSSSTSPSPPHQFPPLHTRFPCLSLLPHSFSSSVCPSQVMDLKEVLDVLEQLAPLSLAETWDNVGLLVEPSKPRPIKTILLTNDLTMPVMDEAEAMGCDLIISYHPPLFRPIKRLVQKDWKQRLAVRAVEAGMAVYSPHTSWDSVKGGVNDWLIGGMGSGCVSVLSQAPSSAPQRHKVEFSIRNQEQLDAIMVQLKESEAGGLLQYTTVRSEPEGYNVSVTCSGSSLTPCVQTLVGHAAVSQSLIITQLQQTPLLGCGPGRLCVLDEPVTVATAVQRMKAYLGLPHLRLALGHLRSTESYVNTVAVCAGSGASVLQGVKADLYFTGEMSHHEVLDAVAKGTSVILSDHSNSERGFLTMFKERLSVRLPESVTVAISKSDRDPLEVV